MTFSGSHGEDFVMNTDDMGPQKSGYQKGDITFLHYCIQQTL